MRRILKLQNCERARRAVAVTPGTLLSFVREESLLKKVSRWFVIHKTSITLVLSFIQEREYRYTGIQTLKEKANVEAEYERGAMLHTTIVSCSKRFEHLL